jgi:hypothetical protein
MVGTKRREQNGAREKRVFGRSLADGIAIEVKERERDGRDGKETDSGDLNVWAIRLRNSLKSRNEPEERLVNWLTSLTLTLMMMMVAVVVVVVFRLGV